MPACVRSSTFGNDEELGDELPPSWTLSRFQEEAKKALAEYFVSLEVEEIVARAQEILAACPCEADELGVLAIRLALDRDEGAQRAVVSFLSRPNVLDRASLIRSFEKLFCTWEDIAIDTPKAPEALLMMLHGCVQGGVVCPTLLTRLPENLLHAGLKDGDKKPFTDMLHVVVTEMKQFKERASQMLEEYFVALRVDEVAVSLKELGMQSYHHEFVKKAIVLSFSQHSEEISRGETLALLSQLMADGVISKDDLQWGLTRLLGSLDDLELDCPRATEFSAEFISLLVAQELVSVPFLRRCRLLRIGGATGLKVIESVLRKNPDAVRRTMNTVQFKREVETMILEYFSSGDKAEFGRCVRDLAPLSSVRGAELIRKIMSFAMERSGNECEMALQLIICLSLHEELESDAIELGFDELYSRMPDIQLDVPDAEEMAQSFVVEAKKSNILREAWPEPVLEEE